MLQYLVGWLAAAFTLLAIDAVWLGFVARDFYQRQIGQFMRDDVWFGVAALFYIFYSLCVVILVAAPALRSGGLGQALLFGAILGLCAYGTYDITNLATLRGWPVTMAIVDMAWGTFLTAMISGAAYLAMGLVKAG